MQPYAVKVNDTPNVYAPKLAKQVKELLLQQGYNKKSKD
jgi:hypothetical protein